MRPILVLRRDLLLGRLLLIATALGALGACATSAGRAGAGASAAVAPAEPLAFLWEVTRPEAPDRPLYLTGTIHAGSAAHPLELPPSFEAAFERAGSLVIELDPDRAKAEASQMQQLLLQLGLFTPPDHLSAHLSQETLATLAPELGKYGLTLAQVEPLRPWFLSMTLEVLSMQKAGYQATEGLEQRLLKTGRAAKRIVELETAEAQLRMLAGIPVEVQDRMLREQIRQAALMPVTLAGIAAAWEGGNPDAIAEKVFDDLAKPEYKPLYEALYFARNRTMADKIAPLVGGSDICFVAVGAAHLVGDRGILELLAQKGLRVRQLPRSAQSATATK